VIIRTDKPNHGFSLVELLLTLVLILCLAAASVFTFTTLYRSANLDEGYDRFQSLIRFAQAEAATTGHKVRLQFVSARPAGTVADKSDDQSELRDIEVTWEADVLNAPGVFQVYTNKTWSEEMVNELIGVQKVQSIESPNAPPQVASSENVMDSGEETSGENNATAEFPSITFYPDGSCDSAEIILASRNPEDERRVEVRLGGILGSVTSRTVSAESEIPEVEAAEAEQEYNDLFENSRPVSSSLSDSSGEPAF